MDDIPDTWPILVVSTWETRADFADASGGGGGAGADCVGGSLGGSYGLLGRGYSGLSPGSSGISEGRSFNNAVDGYSIKTTDARRIPLAKLIIVYAVYKINS